MISYVFYLIIFIADSQSSTPIGSKEECLKAGKEIGESVKRRPFEFFCVEGVK